MNGLPTGWFPDPSNKDEEVFWDGERWTGETRRVADAGSARIDDAEDVRVANEEPASSADPLSGANVSREAIEIPTDPSPADISKPPAPRRRKRLIVVSVVILAVLVIGGVVTGISIQNAHNQDVAAAAVKAAKAKAAKAKEAEQEAEAAKAAKDAQDAAERAKRAAAVVNIQASIKKMAEDDISKGVLDGPVLGVSCNPVNGGSTDDLTDVTTAFDCFVGNKDNGDGTQSGYFFNATMNWSTGSYTYGLGKSH